MASAARPLRWWMVLVGLFYIALGVMFVPPLNEARIGLILPGLAAPSESVDRKALLDWMFVFGLDLLVIGAFLVYGARRPLEWIPLVYVVVGLELVRGILDDLYYISRGYVEPTFYVGFIALHLVIIGTGLWAARRARRAA